MEKSPENAAIMLLNYLRFYLKTDEKTGHSEKLVGASERKTLLDYHRKMGKSFEAG